MVTTGMIERVFLIRFDGMLGSCVVVFFDGKHWIFTAKHLFNEEVPTSLELNYDAEWKNITVSSYQESASQDIAIFQGNIAGFPNGNGFKLGGTMGIGQKLCFLGFPLGLSYIEASFLGNKPIPLYKEGALSGIDGIQDDQTWIIDAVNNEGFSGGPVFSLPANGNARDISLVGIVSSYKARHSPLFRLSSSGEEIESSLQYVKENLGIMVSSPIRFALRMISTDWENEAGRTPQT